MSHRPITTSAAGSGRSSTSSTRRAGHRGRGPGGPAGSAELLGGARDAAHSRRKGHVRHEQDGPRYVYLPTVARDNAKRSAMRHMLQTFFDGSAEQAISALLDDPSAQVLRRGARSPGAHDRPGARDRSVAMNLTCDLHRFAVARRGCRWWTPSLKATVMLARAGADRVRSAARLAPRRGTCLDAGAARARSLLPLCRSRCRAGRCRS